MAKVRCPRPCTGQLTRRFSSVAPAVIPRTRRWSGCTDMPGQARLVDGARRSIRLGLAGAFLSRGRSSGPSMARLKLDGPAMRGRLAAFIAGAAAKRSPPSKRPLAGGRFRRIG